MEESVSDANALAGYLKEADSGNATDRALDVTKFTLGYGDIGLAWLSIGGSSTRAPATEAASNDVLESMAKVKAAHKTSIQTESLAVNTSLSGEGVNAAPRAEDAEVSEGASGEVTNGAAAEVETK